MTGNDRRIQLLRWMILARVVDDRMAKLKAQGEVPGSVFLGRGQEAFAGAAGVCLRPGDVFAPLIRDLGCRLAIGEDLLDIVRTHTGKATGPMRGRDGNIHRGVWAKGLLPMISHLGAMVSAVNGVLLARRLKGQQKPGDLDVGVASVGDGCMATGALHEALNQAAVERLPLVLLVANNQYAYSTTNDRSFACRDLVDRAAGYGVAGHRCDGTDADACLQTLTAAVAAARAGGGPQMVVAELLRLAGHGTHDDASYVSDEVKSRYGDCVQLYERALLVTGAITAADAAQIWEDARARIEAAIEHCRPDPEPDPAAEDWTAYAERDLTNVRWSRG
jgi:pyruvate dehydrogenase E1 component alpha subunit/2-oxoisovalerate dehydrogenase E1 component alpha subunit